MTAVERLRGCVRLLRPLHGLKSLLAFVPILCYNGMPTGQMLRGSFSAFFACWLAASGIYAMNDILDMRSDRAHPEKKHRPVASGAIPAVVAALLAVACWSAGFAVLRGAAGASAVLAAYVTVNVCYAAGVKNVPVLETAAVSAGFAARVWCGSFAAGVPVSGWLYVAVTSMACYMTLDKRRGELARSSGGTVPARKVLSSYTVSGLSAAMHACRIASVASYAAWSVSMACAWRSPWPPLTVPLLAAAMSRYDAVMSARGGDTDMVSAAAGDVFLAAYSGLFIAAAAVSVRL